MGIHLNGLCVVKWKHLFSKHLLFNDLFRPADGGGTMADRVKAVTQEGKPSSEYPHWPRFGYGFQIFVVTVP